MRCLKYLLILCAALLFTQGHATQTMAMEGDLVTYSFSSTADEDDWLTITANVHGEEVILGLPRLEEWSYNLRRKELCFVADGSTYDTYIGVAVTYLPEDAKWSQLVKDNAEWFCTCGGEECDCELIKLAYSHARINFNGDIVKRLDETIWDKDKVEDKETGEVRFEGPICKTTMIKHGRLFYLVMSRYKGSDEARRPGFEALHNQIANSIPAGGRRVN